MNYLIGNWIWVLLITILLGDLLFPYILANFYPGYNHLKDVMSSLGSKESPVAKWYNLWLIIWGIVFIISSVKIMISYYPISKSSAITGGILIFICGLGGIISGIFPISSEKEIETISGKIHGIASGLGFLALAFFPLISMKVYNLSNVSFLSIISLIIFILGIILFILFLLSKNIIGYSGLWQRLHLLSYYILLISISLNELGIGMSPDSG